MILRSALPFWVEADLLRSRATDALGLQNMADVLADKILPGLSVLTTRARYFSFLCWVRNRLRRYDELPIHKWEVALAFAEAKCHPKDDRTAGQPGGDNSKCRYIGSRNIFNYLDNRDRALRNPTVVFKNPAWRAYRPSMVSLGLIEDGSPWNLTETGQSLAREYEKAIRYRGRGITPLPDAACLSRISNGERRILRTVIGLNRRRIQDGDSTSLSVRRQFVCEVERRFGQNIASLSPDSVLQRYERIRMRGQTDLQKALHAAVIWEWLSLGLNVIFVGWSLEVHAGESHRFMRSLILRLRLMPRNRLPTHLTSIDALTKPETVGRALAAIRHALELLPDDHRVLFFGDDAYRAFEIGRRLLRDKSIALKGRVERFLRDLYILHQQAKGDQLWIVTGQSGNYKPALGPSLQIPPSVQPHAYRLSAFGQIVRDLGGI